MSPKNKFSDMRVWIVISQRGGWNGGPVNMQSLMLLASGCDLAHAPNTTRILFVYSALCFTTCNLRSTLCTVSNSALRWFLSAWFLVSKGTDVISSVLDLFLQCSPHLMSHDTCRWAFPLRSSTPITSKLYNLSQSLTFLKLMRAPFITYAPINVMPGRGGRGGGGRISGGDLMVLLVLR